MNTRYRLIRWRALVVAAFMGVSVAPLLAAIIIEKTTATLDGVDDAGSPSSADSGTGPAKVFKDTTTGIVLEVATARVINQFGQLRIFADRGVPIVDPETSETLTATNDVEIVCRPRSGTSDAKAALVAIYDPTYSEYNP